MASSAPVEVPRVLLVRIPNWTLHAARQSVTTDGALLVLSKGRVIACCAEAEAEGVVIGLRLREAQLRCPLATVVNHDPHLESEAFTAVVEIIEELVPEVHVVRPGVAAMRARGPARFYGGEEAAAEVVWGALESHGHPGAGVAIADGLFTAEQAAYLGERVRIVPEGASPEFLSGLDVGVLGEDYLVRTLRQLGLRRLGQFAELSPRQVQARFGPGASLVHRRVRGFDTSPLRPRTRQRSQAVCLSFDEPLLLAQQVINSARAALEKLISELTTAGQVCTQVTIAVRTAVGVSERTWAHPWQFQACDLLSRLSWQLSEIMVAEDDEAGVIAVQFIPTAHPAADHAQGLFGERPTQHLLHILTKLQDQGGPDAVLTPTLSGGRLFKERCVLAPFGSGPLDARPSPALWPGRVSGPAPNIVFPAPHQVILHDQGGHPVQLVDGELADQPSWLATSKQHRSRVLSWAGPWPMQQRWWNARGTSLARMQLVTEDQHAWLLAGAADRWWIEARYD